ncbi:MAG TPA: hypothetical protein VG099_08780 [Gemmataceae bacterium]|nr:hypothetical protein [Gemmataceae bacterium]
MRQLLVPHACGTMLIGALLLTGCQNDAATQKAKGPTQQANVAPATMPTRQVTQDTQPSAGVYQNVRQAGKRAQDDAELGNLALAYIQYSLENGRGPSGVQDLKGSLSPKMEQALKEDYYVVNWKLSNVSGSTIIAYVKEPDSYGTRLVAKGDRSVTRMTKEEFEQAKAGK